MDRNPRIVHSAAALRAAELGAPTSAQDRARKALERPGSPGWLARELATVNSAQRLAAELNRVSPTAALVDRASRAAQLLHSAQSVAEWSRAFPSEQMADDLLRVTTPPSSALQVSLAAQAEARLAANVDAVARAVRNLEERFSLPHPSELASLFARDAQLRSIAAQFEQREEHLQRAMGSIHQPWLDATRKSASLHGMAALHGIGSVLNHGRGFEDRVSAALRTQLGDWRDPMTIPETVFQDTAARTELYLGRGFNPSLAEFPAEAFREALDIAQLRDEILVPDPVFVPPAPPEDMGAEPGPDHQLKLEAFSHLMAFEYHFRGFIDARLSAAFGKEWPRSRLPKGLCEKWVSRRTEEEDEAKRAAPLIEFAQFTDYVRFTVGMNWEVFAPVFGRPELLRESLQRLRPLRNAIAHGRLITQKDLVLLAAETKRIMDCIRAGRLH